MSASPFIYNNLRKIYRMPLKHKLGEKIVRRRVGLEEDWDWKRLGEEEDWGWKEYQ